MPHDWTAEDIETVKKNKNRTRFQTASHSGWDQYLSGNWGCEIKFQLLEMTTSSHTKWSGWEMVWGWNWALWEPESPSTGAIDSGHAEGIDNTKGKSLICLPDKSLCLLGLGIIEHRCCFQSHTHTHTRTQKGRQPCTYTQTKHSAKHKKHSTHSGRTFNLPQIRYVSGFQAGTQEVQEKIPLKKMSLLKNVFPVVHFLLQSFHSLQTESHRKTMNEKSWDPWSVITGFIN